jgi:uncharacterized radical SAM superfamily Fe-S cluster-containing enzyme
VCQKGKLPNLITNGLRLANRSYVKELKKAGLRFVCFSFNSFSDKVYEKINGKPLLKIKLKALKNLMRENMNIILSVMLVRDINEKELRKIYRFYCRNSNFSLLKIRTASFLGRYSDTQQQIYLSDIINMMSKIIGVNKKYLVEHFLSFSDGFHLPCQLDIKPIPLLLKELKIKKMKKSLFGKIKISFILVSKFGFMGSLGVLTRNLKGKKSLKVGIRVWPDKYRIDLEEIKKCPSSHLICKTGEIIPFCYALTINNKKVLL